MSLEGLKVGSGASLSLFCEVQEISGANSSFLLTEA